MCVANEVPTCAVPMHDPLTSSLWRGVGDVNSECEVVCVEGEYNQGYLASLPRGGRMVI